MVYLKKNQRFKCKRLPHNYGVFLLVSEAMEQDEELHEHRGVSGDLQVPWCLHRGSGSKLLQQQGEEGQGGEGAHTRARGLRHPLRR